MQTLFPVGLGTGLLSCCVTQVMCFWAENEWGKWLIHRSTDIKYTDSIHPTIHSKCIDVLIIWKCSNLACVMVLHKFCSGVLSPVGDISRLLHHFDRKSQVNNLAKIAKKQLATIQPVIVYNSIYFLEMHWTIILSAGKDSQCVDSHGGLSIPTKHCSILASLVTSGWNIQSMPAMLSATNSRHPSYAKASMVNLEWLFEQKLNVKWNVCFDGLGCCAP